MLEPFLSDIRHGDVAGLRLGVDEILQMGARREKTGSQTALTAMGTGMRMGMGMSHGQGCGELKPSLAAALLEQGLTALGLH